MTLSGGYICKTLPINYGDLPINYVLIQFIVLVCICPLFTIRFFSIIYRQLFFVGITIVNVGALAIIVNLYYRFQH